MALWVWGPWVWGSGGVGPVCPPRLHIHEAAEDRTRQRADQQEARGDIPLPLSRVSRGSWLLLKSGLRGEGTGFASATRRRERFFSSWFVLVPPGRRPHRTVCLHGGKGGCSFTVGDFILTFHFKHFISLRSLSACPMPISV